MLSFVAFYHLHASAAKKSWIGLFVHYKTVQEKKKKNEEKRWDLPLSPVWYLIFPCLRLIIFNTVSMTANCPFPQWHTTHPVLLTFPPVPHSCSECVCLCVCVCVRACMCLLAQHLFFVVVVVCFFFWLFFNGTISLIWNYSFWTLTPFVGVFAGIRNLKAS